MRCADRNRTTTFFLCSLLCTLLSFCADSRRNAPPNIVLVTVDTLRADATSPYGGSLATAVFEELAAQGVLFERAFAPTPETAPSHASLFTGQEDLRHGVVRNGAPLADGSETLAELLKAGGYHTAGFVSSWVMDPRFGWAQGFDVYDASFPEEGATMDKELNAYPGAIWKGRDFAGLDRRGELTTSRALEWLGDAGEPWFLFVHYFDPHGPYVPPRRYLPRLRNLSFDMRGRSFQGLPLEQILMYIRLYHGEVLYTSDTIGDLVGGLVKKSSSRPTLLIVTADHGEGLGQHGWMEHSVYLYDEQIRVPLIFRWLGDRKSSARIGAPVSLVDVAPTVLEIAGLPLPGGGMDGRSLAGCVTGGNAPEERPVFGHRRQLEEAYAVHRGDLFSVRTGGWKLIRASGAGHELYDLENDPGEKNNLAGVRSEEEGRLAFLLDAHLSSMPEPAPPQPLTEEERKKLEALGYVE